MKALYRLPVKQGLVIPVPSGTDPIKVNNAEVRWEVDVEGNLKYVILVISGAQIRHEAIGALLSSYPELEELAFRLGSYIANSILIQTGFDAIDPESVLQSSPEIFPETPEEEKDFANSRKTFRKLLNVSYAIRREFQPIEYSVGFDHSGAAASYADGLRVSSPFLRFEQFYKVVEHFFTEKGDKLDNTVSQYASQYDSKYDSVQIKKLRELRNRCIHPNSYSNLGHANPEDLNSVREVMAALPILRELALLLLHHPPT